MQKKYLVLILLAVAIIGGILLTNKTYFNNEMSYEIISYEDTPDYVKELIDIEKETSSWNVEASDGQYVVLTPPKGKSVEVSYVGEDENFGYGVVYKYYYVDEASDDLKDNIKIIKINHYNGSVRGTKTRGK